MYQHRLAWLAGTMLMGLTALSLAQPADSDNGSAKEMPGAVAQQISHNQLLAHKMMGHINLAQMALNLNLPDEAGKQLQRAHSLEEELSTAMPEFKLNSTFDYGKVTYEDKSTLKDSYMPVIDDTFLVSDYEDIYKHAKAVDVDELSAGVMHLRIAVDLKQVDAALDQAEKAIDSEDYGTAATALNDVFKNAIVDEDEIDDPKLLIAENLALAKAFVAQQQYDSARLTVEHVQDRLRTARKGKLATVGDESLNQFSTELDNIRAELRKKDPTLLQQVADGLDRWGDRISGWFS